MEVKEEFSFVRWHGFTTDIWSTEVSNDCLLSFTVHWLKQLFEKKEAVIKPAKNIHRMPWGL